MTRRFIAHLGRTLPLFTVAWLYSAGCSVATAPFEWQMEERFGIDANNNGLIDVPNSPMYVLNGASGEPPRFWVRLEARAPSDATEINWEVRQGDQLVAAREDRRMWWVKLVEGEYSVTVRWQRANGETSTKEWPIRVKDILFVSLGDSFSSGEGNPELVRQWFWENSLNSIMPGSIEASRRYQGHFSEVSPGGPGVAFDVQWADNGRVLDGDEHYDNPSMRGPYTRYWYFPIPSPQPTTALQTRLNSALPLNNGLLVPGQGTEGFVPFPAEEFWHIRSHRSTYAWPARAALALERSDPHTSVTFVHLAASGATVRQGIIGPYAGQAVEPLSKISEPMPSQIDQLRALLGCDLSDACQRTIDILTISIGINDIGFCEHPHSTREEQNWARCDHGG